MILRGFIVKTKLNICFILLLTLIASCRSAVPQSDELQKQEHLIWVYTNLLRRHQADLPELVRTKEADKLARDASCMFLKGKWDKSDSDRKVALNADISVENYYQDSENVVDRAIQTWYHDEKAMRNLLNPSYHKTGIGACKVDQITFFTQILYR